MATTDKIEKARELGKRAFLRGDKSVAAWDKELMAMLAGNGYDNIGAGIPLLKAWVKGWFSEYHKAGMNTMEAIES